MIKQTGLVRRLCAFWPTFRISVTEHWEAKSTPKKLVLLLEHLEERALPSVLYGDGAQETIASTIQQNEDLLDCWLVAAIRERATDDPAYIGNMISTAYEDTTDTPYSGLYYVTPGDSISTAIAMNTSTAEISYSASNGIWLAVFEKAVNAFGDNISDYNDYGAGIPLVTGYEYSSDPFGPSDQASVLASITDTRATGSVEAGEKGIVVAGDDTPCVAPAAVTVGDYTLWTRHAYGVLQADACWVEIQDPFGDEYGGDSNGVMWLHTSDFMNFFNTLDYEVAGDGNHAAPGEAAGSANQEVGIRPPLENVTTTLRYNLNPIAKANDLTASSLSNHSNSPSNAAAIGASHGDMPGYSNQHSGAPLLISEAPGQASENQVLSSGVAVEPPSFAQQSPQAGQLLAASQQGAVIVAPLGQTPTADPVDLNVETSAANSDLVPSSVNCSESLSVPSSADVGVIACYDGRLDMFENALAGVGGWRYAAMLDVRLSVWGVDGVVRNDSLVNSLESASGISPPVQWDGWVGWDGGKLADND